MNDSIRVRDPRLIVEDHENDRVTFATEKDERITVEPGTIIEGYGEHYFEGTVRELQYNGIGEEHYWVVFENVTLGNEQVSEHTLPLGELAAQIEDGSVSVH